MKLLNERFIPYLVTYNPETPSLNYVENATGVRALEQFDYTVWYCLFSCHNSFKVYDLRNIIPADILERIMSGEVFLAVDNSLEPFLKSIDSIYENLVIKAGIPERQIIFLCNMPDAAEYTANLAKRLDRQPIRIMWFSCFEQDLNLNVLTDFNQEIRTLEQKQYTKKFLNLNRRWRLHRPFLMALMYKMGLIDQGYVSFGPCDPGDDWESRWAELINYYREDAEMSKLIWECEGVRQLPPLYLDTGELHINRAVFTHSTDQYYYDTYFSVVAETTYHTRNGHIGTRFLSEKIFKAIAMAHPFILVSVPNSLAVLRQLGYKTFDPFIDESYDYEYDDGKRMVKIANEIERLSTFNDAQRYEFIENVRSICKYNYDLLKSKKTFIQEMN